MKIEIDVSEFWIEEGHLEDSLKAKITNEVVTTIRKEIKDKVDAEITQAIKAALDGEIKLLIDLHLDAFAKGGVIKNRNGDQVPFSEHFKQVFENSTGWNNPAQTMANLAEKFGKDLKARYDALFANRIVTKLNEQGMLKDEVVKLLIS